MSITTRYTWLESNSFNDLLSLFEKINAKNKNKIT